jgi:hypothetical protein
MSKQLELPIPRVVEPDRNFREGGRSFYFFDFDDNVAFLSTPLFLFDRHTGRELQISSREFAEQSQHIGKRGIYKDYVMKFEPDTGTFRRFRDKNISWLARLLGQRQVFVQDLAAALTGQEIEWKGPSWNCFFHAVFNKRPVSLITARGHHPETMRAGIRLWVKERHLPYEPNYLSLYPVSHPSVQAELGHSADTPIPKLKQAAVRASVERAFATYGMNPHHRFGMSDDDPQNVKWILEEMTELKSKYRDNAFYVFQTHQGQMIKHKVFVDHVEDQVVDRAQQLTLFDT